MTDDALATERLLAGLLRAPDPAAALSAAIDDPSTSPELKAALQAVEPDGLRMTALLVARLRFERLMQGSRQAGDWFLRDPQTFTQAFRRYHVEVPPTAFFPASEASLFDAWSKRNGSRARGVDGDGAPEAVVADEG